jgi:putative endonuclease
VAIQSTGVIGSIAEQKALHFLIARGLRPVARNFRCRGGEIDLIMLDGNCLTFVEVRYRASAKFISAHQTIDNRKQRKIIRTAAMYIARNRQFATHTVRFDVVAVEGSQQMSIAWISDAFRPNDASL